MSFHEMSAIRKRLFGFHCSSNRLSKALVTRVLQSSFATSRYFTVFNMNCLVYSAFLSSSQVHMTIKRHHLTTYCSLSPNNKIASKKLLSSKRLSNRNRVAKALRPVAYGVGISKSYIGENQRKMSSRLGAQKPLL